MRRCLQGRKWCLVGPFTFDRKAYEAEVQKMRDLASQLAELEAQYPVEYDEELEFETFEISDLLALEDSGMDIDWTTDD